MSYVIASYGITAVILLAYGVHLAREKKSLTREGQASLGDRSNTG